MFPAVKLSVGLMTMPQQQPQSYGMPQQPQYMPQPPQSYGKPQYPTQDCYTTPPQDCYTPPKDCGYGDTYGQQGGQFGMILGTPPGTEFGGMPGMPGASQPGELGGMPGMPGQEGLQGSNPFADGALGSSMPGQQQGGGLEEALTGLVSVITQAITAVIGMFAGGGK